MMCRYICKWPCHFLYGLYMILIFLFKAQLNEAGQRYQQAKKEKEELKKIVEMTRVSFCAIWIGSLYNLVLYAPTLYMTPLFMTALSTMEFSPIASSMMVLSLTMLQVKAVHFTASKLLSEGFSAVSA